MIEKSFYVSGVNAVWQDFPDWELPAIIVYFEGCGHHCPGCQNFVNQAPKYEHLVSEDLLFKDICQKSRSWKTDKVVLSGGDPFFHSGWAELKAKLQFITKLQKAGYSVCVYTGYELEDILGFYKRYPDEIKPDFLKCGRYDQDSARISGKFKYKLVLASPNQSLWRLQGDEYIKLTEQGVLSVNDL